MQRAKGKAGGGKGSDPFSQRTTRNERFAQMSRQEQLIEQKKKELLAKVQSATTAALKPMAAAASASASGSPNKPLVRPTGLLGKRPNWWKNKGSALAAAAAPEAEEPVIKIEPHQQKFPKMMEVAPIKREFKTEFNTEFKTEFNTDFKTDFKTEPMHHETKYSPTSSSYSYDRGNEARAASPYSPSRLSPEPDSPVAAPPVYAAPPPSMLVPPFPPPALTSAPPPPLMMAYAAPPPQSAPQQPPPIALMSVPPPNLSAPPPPMQFLQQPPPPQQFVMETQQLEVAKVSPAGVEASNAACRQLADMVAEGGDEIEEMARERNRDDPAMWFLYQTESDAYHQYRDLVSNLRMLKSASKESAAAAAKNAERMRKRKSRWAPEGEKVPVIPPLGLPVPIIPKGGPPPMLSTVRRTDTKLLAYARSAYGTIDLSEEDWIKCEDHYKVHLLYNEMMRKKEQLARLEAAGKHKYDYDSDEDVDGGTWEHKVRHQEMEATNKWAAELTKQAEGKHHIGDFLPPAELERFMEQYSAAKEGKPLDVSDYKEFKLKEDNIGFKMLQKLGWSEGQGLGSEGQGIVEPVSKGNSRSENHGLGVKRPDNFNSEDDEYDAYRKRMMLAYRFRPNPLNNPRRNYY